MKISFIVPVYNNFDITKACISSLRESLPKIEYEIIIVDDSSDISVSRKLESLEGDRLKLVRNPENFGYAKSNNVGARLATGTYLFLINNDLVFKSGWLEPMLSALSSRKAGIVGNVQIDAKTGEIDHSGFLFDGNGALRHKRSKNPGKRYSRFAAVTGACLALRRKTFIKLGGFDEKFENGCEDIDLCFKAQQVGLKTLVANKSEILHHVSSTRSSDSLRDERNTRHFQDKWQNQIINEMARSWPSTYLIGLARGEKPFMWAAFRQAVVRLLPIRLDAAPIASLIVEAKLRRNERHWLSLLDGKSDEMIKRSYQSNDGRWHGTQFSYKGLEPNRIEETGRWIKEIGEVRLGSGFFLTSVQVVGVIKPPQDGARESEGDLGLRITINGAESKKVFPVPEGKFEIGIEDVPAIPENSSVIEFELIGVTKSNANAWLGRVTRKWFFLSRERRQFWKLHREQKLNQRLIVKQVKLNHEMLLDFDNQPTSPVNFDFLRRSTQLGVNLVGWFDAELGVGESVRIAAKALDTTSIRTNLVSLKVNCLASREDKTFDDRLVDENTYPINVFHIDAPQSADIDHHHGPGFREGKRNIGYWAWELPEFPDDWVRYFSYFDEIWTPSNFVKDAVTMKSPIPVITIPHCIEFAVPEKQEREKFGLPSDKFLFLFAYDLNSYQPRKNPMATIQAFKSAFGGNAGRDVGLVIKTHSTKQNQGAFEELKEHLQGIENIYLIENRLSRADVYSLMYSVDSYISLHRSEGFGLTVAESMYLGKPVLSTNWSATSEFVNRQNGCPVDFELVELERNFGPYSKGQHWANAKIDHAAALMQQLVSDSDFARKIGEEASQTIRERFAPGTIGKIYEKRMKSHALW